MRMLSKEEIARRINTHDELLEACKDLVKLIQDMDWDEECLVCTEQYKDALQAINKAEGKE